MTRISSVLLDDTLKLIQLARETARIQGQSNQAEQLKPLVEQLKTLTSDAREIKSNNSTAPAGGVLQQNDFKTLLSKIQNHSSSPTPAVSGIAPQSGERSHMVIAMASGGMSHLDIARQMGMTLEEVNNIVTLHTKKDNIRRESYL